ncbi:bifunctional (p)ppGpp synthetase/guanosine-3',5'-bis(diphosphate) 3'-pyrophosphohydrolase [Patescibacteria group bacterium]|nr:bifunctional (p)ppGpp synthetase/guanosine-3',5'-bis(diphosphate) 3'-pyrophosphohydrolase [Patescibacteria group bacterium]
MDQSQELTNTLVKKIKHISKSEIVQIKQAIDFAKGAHRNQTRMSGEPYYHHSLQTAITLADMKMDAASIIAGILHDTLEDTDVVSDEIQNKFSPEILQLVDGVTKVSQIRLKNLPESTEETNKQKQLESLRKLFLAMAKDLRVVIIKLADRLHNVQTLQYIPTDKQTRIAEETMEIYVPLANRAGLWHIKSQLEDNCFKYLFPQDYLRLYSVVRGQTRQEKKYIERVTKKISAELKESKIKNFKIDGRTKNLYSIYIKTLRQNKSVDQIYDIYAVRIITSTLKDCYTALGVIHSLWKPIPGRFKDFIAVPKPNGYQSLHTSVFALDGQKLEIQIRTEAMHHHAEYGVAAHWLYKEKDKSRNEFNWVKELSRIKDIDLSRLEDEIKIDLFEDRIFVYTPKGEVKDLPIGSTPIDFAYSVHTDIGHHLIGAKVNQKIVTLDYKLANGDIVEILTSKTSPGPKRQWLDISQTNFAKSKIRSFFKKINQTEHKKTGEKILNDDLASLNLPKIKDIPSPKIKTLIKSLPYKNIEDIFVAISNGDVSSKKIIKKIFPESEIFRQKIVKRTKKTSAPASILFGHNQRLSYKLSTQCCQPRYPEPIIGYITRGQGISVHLLKCKNTIHKDPNRLLIAHWKETKDYQYYTSLEIKCQDRVGMLHDISEVIMRANINLIEISVMQKTSKYVKIKITINVKDLDQLTSVIKSISNIPGVESAKKI